PRHTCVRSHVVRLNKPDPYLLEAFPIQASTGSPCEASVMSTILRYASSTKQCACEGFETTMPERDLWTGKAAMKHERPGHEKRQAVWREKNHLRASIW